MLYQLSYLPDVYAVYIEFRQKQGNRSERRKIETREFPTADSPVQPEQSASLKTHFSDAAPTAASG